jgi:hypothetical protein
VDRATLDQRAQGLDGLGGVILKPFDPLSLSGELGAIIGR